MARRNVNRPGANHGWVFVLGVIFIGSILADYIVPALLLSVLGFGGYRMLTRRQRLAGVEATKRIEDLKMTIKQADNRIKLLEGYKADSKDDQYVTAAQQFLPQLAEIEEEATSLKDQIGLSVYQRIRQKITDTQESIQKQLAQIETNQRLAIGQVSLSMLEKEAPEIIATYRNVQRDHANILKKIEASTAGNQAELLAIHEANMHRFEDILKGYMKIKASPKDYYNAEERLNKAKLALEQFDTDLDEMLRELNESELQDFEVSLRMMQAKTKANKEKQGD